MPRRKNRFSAPAVYQIEDTVSGKFYIGATGDITTRLNEHVRDLENNQHNNKNLQETYNNNETSIVINILPIDTVETAFLLEKQLIKENKDNPDLLNIRGGCEPAMLGKSLTEEQKKQISATLKKKYVSGELVSPMKGTNHTEEAKQLISAAHKNNYANGYKNPFQNKQHTDDFKKIKSKQTEEQWKDPAFKQFMIEAGLERAKDPEFIKKMSELTTERMKDPAVRKQMSELATERMKDPAVRQNLAKKTTERMKDPVNRQKSSEGAKQQWQDPIKREKLIEKLKAVANKPENKEVRRKLTTERMKDPVNRQKSSEGAKQQWQDPDMRNNLIDQAKKRWEDPEYRARCTRKGNPVTIDGIVYDSNSSAIKALGVSEGTFYKNLRKGIYK